jgi:hypothetical protein
LRVGEGITKIFGRDDRGDIVVRVMKPSTSLYTEHLHQTVNMLVINSASQRDPVILEIV